jgi:hypothetical protein
MAVGNFVSSIWFSGSGGAMNSVRCTLFRENFVRCKVFCRGRV